MAGPTGATGATGPQGLQGPTGTVSSVVANDITVNGIKVGRGSGNQDSCTVLGMDALLGNATGGPFTAIGVAAL